MVFMNARQHFLSLQHKFWQACARAFSAEQPSEYKCGIHSKYNSETQVHVDFYFNEASTFVI